MKAKPRDASVCLHCNGTGTLLFTMGKFTYSAPCKISVNSGQQPELIEGTPPKPRVVVVNDHFEPKPTQQPRWKVV